MKVRIAGKLPSGAKSHHSFSVLYGATKVVPSQNSAFTIGCGGKD